MANFGYYATDDEGNAPKKIKKIDDNTLDFDRDYSLKTVSRVDENKLKSDSDETETALDDVDVDTTGSSPEEIVTKKTIKKVLGVVNGYMKADAIRAQANYESDVMELNADLSRFEAGEQQGVDFSKIVRYGAQVDDMINDTRAAFVSNEQEGGAAQDIIAENTLQGTLNKIAMINEAQNRIGSADFAKRLSYQRASQNRRVGEVKARKEIAKGWLKAMFE